MFTITAGKGFQLTFANGYGLSVQWGSFNYCDNRWESYDDVVLGEAGSPNAEIAVILPNGDIDHDSIQGWLTPDQVLAKMVEVSGIIPT
jgi:hypothetical protein